MDADLLTRPRSLSPIEDLEYFSRPASPTHSDPGVRTRSNTPDTDHDAPSSARRSLKDRSQRSFVSRILPLNDAVRTAPRNDAVSSTSTSAAPGHQIRPGASEQRIGRGVAAERAHLLVSTMAGIQTEIHKVDGAVENGFRGLTSTVERTGRDIVGGLTAVSELAGAIRESTELNKQINDNLAALTRSFQDWAFPPELWPVEEPVVSTLTDDAMPGYDQSFSLPFNTAKSSMVPLPMSSNDAPSLLSRIDTASTTFAVVPEFGAATPPQDNGPSSSKPPALLSRLDVGPAPSGSAKAYSVFLGPCNLWVQNWKENLDVIISMIDSKAPDSASMANIYRLFHKRDGTVMHLMFNDPYSSPAVWANDARHFAFRWNQLLHAITPAYYAEMPPVGGG